MNSFSDPDDKFGESQDSPSWKEAVTPADPKLEEAIAPESDDSKDDKGEEDGPVDLSSLEIDTSTPESIKESLSALPGPVAAMMQGVMEAAKEREEYHRDLYGDESFDSGDTSLVSDISSYDTTAYTKSETELTTYRYNLSDDAYAGDGVDIYGDGYDGTGTGGAAGSTGAGHTRSGATGGSTWGSGWSYSGSSGYSGWGNRSWMSSWYSGYNSADRAIQGVHNHVATFVKNTDYGSLEILPNLDDPEETSVETQAGAGAVSLQRSEYAYDNHLTMIARIDSSLYEKLGISEAQQHYIVDCISQVMAAEKLPDPGIITVLQASDHPSTRHYFRPTCLPNVTKEIITEILRARGVSLLVEEMPGWLKRVTAFRGVMYISEPPDSKIPAAFLMYAVWEKDTVETIEHEDAVKCISKIEAVLDGMPKFDSRRFFNRAGSESDSRTYRKERSERLKQVLSEIDLLLIEYITASGGPIGFIIRNLREMYKRFSELILEREGVIVGDEIKEVEEKCSTLIDLVHDHNRTFAPDPTHPLSVKHHEFPSCPNKALLPEPVKQRIELSRKCVFNLQRIPGESSVLTGTGDINDPDSYEKISRALRRVSEMLDEFMSQKKNQTPEEENEEYVKNKFDPSDAGSKRSGVNCTNHPELRSKRSIVHGFTDRNFSEEDPEFNRDVVIYDATAVA